MQWSESGKHGRCGIFCNLRAVQGAGYGTAHNLESGGRTGHSRQPRTCRAKSRRRRQKVTCVRVWIARRASGPRLSEFSLTNRAMWLSITLSFISFACFLINLREAAGFAKAYSMLARISSSTSRTIFGGRVREATIAPNGSGRPPVTVAHSSPKSATSSNPWSRQVKRPS